MKQVRNALTYANVVATIALFLAVSSGAVYAATNLGKNSVRSQNIAAKAVKSQDLAKGAVKSSKLAANAVTTGKIKKGAVTSAKVKAGSLNRGSLAAGTLAGLQVIDAGAASGPGLNTETPGGTPVPLTGTATFTPLPGKSYELLVEISGTPTDADGDGEEACNTFVTVLVNGVPMSSASLWHNANGTPPFNFRPVGSSSNPIGLQQAGQPQTISALAFGDSNCSPATTGSLRVVVVEFG